ncbi:MAG: patatin-like phospholipase family protein [Chloroflexi bacterium]|nr:patatin-like phospholipase family protein [Chloroflexota bacterium]
MKGKKLVGLALGSGAARGLAHIGVLAALEQEGIPVDVVAGTSAGAIFGAVYAHSRDAARMKAQALELSSMKLAPMVDPSLSRGGLIRGKKITNMLAAYLGRDVQFSDLKVPFACVATDLDSGAEVVLDSGPVLDAVRASFSVPAVFSVVKWQGRYLVDGGLVNPVPVSVARRLGADVVIAVNVIPEVSQRLGKARDGGARQPNIVHVIMQSLYIGTYCRVRSCMEGADIIIEPEVGHIGPGDFHQAKELIERGEAAARAALPQINQLLAG